MKFIYFLLSFLFLSFSSLYAQSDAYLVIPNGDTTLRLVGGSSFIVMNNADWVNKNSPSAFVKGNSTVVLSGTGNQQIAGTSSTVFNKLQQVKTSGTVSLGNKITVTGELKMTSGNLSTTSANILEIGTSPSATGTIDWTGGTVVGPMKRWFASNVDTTQASGIFPVGKSNVNRYAQINFSSVPPAGGYITAEYKTGLSPILYKGLPSTVNGQLIVFMEDEGYWDITPYSSAGVAYGALNNIPYNLKLRGLLLTTVTDISTLRLIKSPGPAHTTWSSAGIGTHVGNTGNPADVIVSNTGTIGFSWFNIGSNNTNVLPVKLQYYSAICKEKEVTVEWTSLTEINNSHYTLDKSTDGQNWTLVEEVTGAGFSQSPIRYQVTDRVEQEQTTYYRLTQTDYNGNSELMGITDAGCSPSAQPISVSVYPNPAEDVVTVEVTSGNQSGDGTVYITDLQGRRVAEQLFACKQGLNYVTVNRNQLAAGAYLLQVNVNGINLPASQLILK